MESSNPLWVNLLIGLHIPPAVFLIQLVPFVYYLKLLSAASLFISLYVTSLLISTNTAANLKSSTLKSGTYLTKASLTLNDLRIIKFRNLLGGGSDKMTKTALVENNRKIMSQTIADDKEKLSSSGGGGKSGLSRSTSHHQKIQELKVNDNVREVDVIEQLMQSKGVKRAGSFRLKSSQAGEASLLTIVIKKCRRA